MSFSLWWELECLWDLGLSTVLTKSDFGLNVFLVRSSYMVHGSAVLSRPRLCRGREEERWECGMCPPNWVCVPGGEVAAALHPGC